MSSLMSELDTKTRPVILAVDDAPANLSLLQGLLHDEYQIKLAPSGSKALSIANAQPPDLILLDVMMPEMDGYEVCLRLKADPATRDIPVIFITAKIDVPDEERGFDVGAVDFIHKPISPPILLARIRAQLRIKQFDDALRDKNAWLQGEVQRRVGELMRIQGASVQVMVSMAEFRDEDTGRHIVRTQKYVELLGNALYEHGYYAPQLNPALIEQMTRMAPLHDIGKIAVPDGILLKPGKLDDREMMLMKNHAAHGAEILKRWAVAMEDSGGYLQVGMQIARNHHERWDGSGYPDNLAGEAIPLPARVMALADVYDALRTRRPYKEPMSHEMARDIIVKGSGSHFDPLLVEVWLEKEETVRQISEEWADEE